MSFRSIAWQIWAVTSVAWVAITGVMAGSAYLEVSFRDSVRLEQHAKDLRASGIDPASVDWSAPMVSAAGFAVPASGSDAGQMWQSQRGYYTRLAGSLPVGLLIFIEFLASLGFGQRNTQRMRAARKRPRALVFREVADSVDLCRPVPVPVIVSSLR